MTQQEIDTELSEVVKFNTVSGNKVARIYNLNRLIFNDSKTYCSKCPSIIRNIFNKLKKYHESRNN